MLFAEREGFEPPDPLRSTVFKTAAFDHSAISPKSNFISFHVIFREVECKGRNIFRKNKRLRKKSCAVLVRPYAEKIVYILMNFARVFRDIFFGSSDER